MSKFISMTEKLYAYVLEMRSGAKDPVLAGVKKDTDKLGQVARMSISPEQASFLTILAASIGAKNAVEIGTFTGSSSISIARGLAAGGRLVCFDQNPEWTKLAAKHWKSSGLDQKIELRLGNAADLLKVFAPSELIDFVFIDADKTGYDFYYETILPKVRTGGIILFDNMLRGGDVILPVKKQSLETKAIVELNAKLAKDSRIQCVLLPIADGLQICRKI
ncbi:MAG: class I SAM-dependent methyltransferase [Spirochaetia bacterium]|nr:class I SAM-dependent methyltransferase [Spirochaetia bacterium]